MRLLVSYTYLLSTKQAKQPVRRPVWEVAQVLILQLLASDSPREHAPHRVPTGSATWALKYDILKRPSTSAAAICKYGCCD